MDWCKYGSIISNGAWGTIEERGASHVPESKMLVPAEWSVWIGRVTWEEEFDVLGNWDDKLSES
jgi:hypothetical protein